MSFIPRFSVENHCVGYIQQTLFEAGLGGSGASLFWPRFWLSCLLSSAFAVVARRKVAPIHRYIFCVFLFNQYVVRLIRVFSDVRFRIQALLDVLNRWVKCS